ncbi:MAG: alpha/beta hydrolase family protein [Nocardioides sp.]
MRSGLLTALLPSLVLVVAGCSGTGAPATDPAPPKESPQDPASASTSASAPAPEPEATKSPKQEPAPAVSVPGLAEQRHRGDRLRLGAVREQTAAYTSYDITYRSRSTTGPRQGGEESYRISGVLNVPTGRGPFPAVVLAHGYIDPAFYVRGQGMTRERGYLASRGYVALHVDYRNHAESEDDPNYQNRMRLGYSADVINAVKALRSSREVPVDDDRMALFGRSMGGGVILKALVAAPGLVQAAAPWASVSSLESQNYRQFMADDPEDADVRSELIRRHGTPAQDPAFWRQNSSRPYFEEITEPVLMVHGNFDDTCPPRWARATQRALVSSGVNSQLEWYDDGHAFGPRFFAAMDRTIRFFDTQLG